MRDSGVVRSLVVKGYRDLLVWQRAMDLVVQVYRLSDTLPRDEKYRLVQRRGGARTRPSRRLPAPPVHCERLVDGNGNAGDDCGTHGLRVERIGGSRIGPSRRRRANARWAGTRPDAASPFNPDTRHLTPDTYVSP